MLNTPVVLIGFNRPNEIQQVFNKIKEIKPRKLFLISDGARLNKPNEQRVVEKVRSIMTNVDWDCEIYKNFSDTNLGCKRRISSGLDWVFSQVDKAIILEDDCLPNLDFFRFCEAMLKEYENNLQIGQVSGANFLRDQVIVEDSYYFSKFMHVWGWATWKDRWEGYDPNIKNWPVYKKEKSFSYLFSKKEDYLFWEGQFDKVFSGKINTWDHQWTFHNWKQNRINIIPSKNLISNIGFGENATHTTGESIVSNIALSKLETPYIHPNKFELHTKAEKLITELFFTNGLKRRIWNRLFK